MADDQYRLRAASSAASTPGGDAAGDGPERWLPFDVATAKRRHSPIERRLLRSQSLLLPAGSVHNPPRPTGVKPRLAMYVRISQQVEDSVSIRRQYDECLAEVKRLGGSIDLKRDVFHDVDVSAAKGHYRQGIEELLVRIQDEKAYDGVVVWELPRALRSQVEAVNLRRIFMQGSCDLHIVSARDISLWGPSSAFFDLYVLLAERESKTLGERQKSRQRLLSIYGVPRHSAVFGMTTEQTQRFIEGRATPVRQFVPDETPRAELGGRSPADLMRELIEMVLAGRSLTAVARDWHAAGYRGPLGGTWSSLRLGELLRNPTLGGLAHRGYQLLGADGELLQPGSAERPLEVGVGLVEAATWLRAASTVASRTASPRSTRETRLGSLLWCGRCGNRVNGRGLDYLCSDARTGSQSCGTKNSLRAELLETFVFDAVVAALQVREHRAAAEALNSEAELPETQRLETAIDDLHRRLGEIEELWLSTAVKDGHAKARFAKLRASAEQQLAERQAELTAHSIRGRGHHVADLYRDDECVAQAFRDTSPHAQVSVLAEMIDRVVVHPQPARCKGFVPERIQIVWATAWTPASTKDGVPS